MIDIDKYRKLLGMKMKDVVYYLIRRIIDDEGGIRKVLYNRLVRYGISSGVMVKSTAEVTYDGKYFSPTTKSKVELYAKLMNNIHYDKIGEFEIPIRLVYADPDVIREAIKYLEVRNPTHGKYVFNKDEVELVGAHIFHYDTSTPIGCDFEYSVGDMEARVSLTSSLGYGGYNGNLGVSVCRKYYVRNIGSNTYSEVEKCIYGDVTSNCTIDGGMEIKGKKDEITVREVDKKAFRDLMKALSWATMIYTEMVMDNVAVGLEEVLDKVKKVKWRENIALFILYP